MKNKDIEEVRNFLLSASKQFERVGIYLERVRFNRKENGQCTNIILDYEERDSQQGEQG